MKKYHEKTYKLLKISNPLVSPSTHRRSYLKKKLIIITENFLVKERSSHSINMARICYTKIITGDKNSKIV